jgi:hypothetical protein
MKKNFFPALCARRGEREKALEKIFHYLQEVIRRNERKFSGKMERRRRRKVCFVKSESFFRENRAAGGLWRIDGRGILLPVDLNCGLIGRLLMNS